ncbi:MAG: EAL domain-containing protein [Limnoraphis sp. WC205]|jgi:diguanylate cyclase (GGDEF)-like protein/PAS domain S-box-containing protein|nr:EAL domain-containing protein [Limnoraphis sp. WC205]
MNEQVIILVVEDERLVARDLQATLEDMGYRIPEITDTGESAIQKVAEIQPDLVLMDIRLAGEMDGIEAANIITNHFHVPVIYITAHADEDTLSRAKLTEPFGYLVKPFDERDLKTTIEIALYKHQIEQQLRDQSQWLSTILDSIADAVIATDKTGKVNFINPVAEELTGWSSDEAVGKSLTDIFNVIHEDSRHSIQHLVLKAIEEGQTLTLSEPILLIQRNGREIPIDDSVAPIFYSQNEIQGSVLVFRDITQQKMNTEKLQYQAFHDPLTGLLNRHGFMKRLQEADNHHLINPDFTFAIFFLDLDRFKVTNDSLGHQVGDQLLWIIAIKLIQSVRSIDAVARFGGDEFAILLENLHDLNEIYHIAQRIRQEIIKPIYINEHKIFTNVSIGIVLSSMGYNKVDDLIRDADIAMYRAKTLGRGRYEIFNATMREEVQFVQKLESDLKRALDRNEFQVYYQPIVNLKTNEINGFEALVRWNHPERGPISPAHFIPVAEQTDLITFIDWKVMRDACQQVHQWNENRKNHPPFVLSVNLSARQFVQANLIEQVTKILNETGLEKHSLKIEMTETALLENPEGVAESISQLKSLGIGLSLDDFGTGYSSLSYLYRFPVDSLKIDISFVRNMNSESHSFEIVRTLIILANALKIQAIAEGIETAEQLNTLQHLDCPFGQGYYFSKPLSAENMQKLLFNS